MRTEVSEEKTHKTCIDCLEPFPIEHFPLTVMNKRLKHRQYRRRVCNYCYNQRRADTWKSKENELKLARATEKLEREKLIAENKAKKAERLLAKKAEAVKALVDKTDSKPPRKKRRYNSKDYCPPMSRCGVCKKLAAYICSVPECPMTHQEPDYSQEANKAAKHLKK